MVSMVRETKLEEDKNTYVYVNLNTPHTETASLIRHMNNNWKLLTR